MFDLLGGIFAAWCLRVHHSSPIPITGFSSLSNDNGKRTMPAFRGYWRSRERIYGAWALLFAYLLCDDALSIHERVGGVVASAWGYAPAFLLRAQDFGELTVSGAVGSAFLVLIAYLK